MSNEPWDYEDATDEELKQHSEAMADKTLCSITFKCGCKFKEELSDSKIDEYKENGVKIRRLKK